MGKYFTDAAGNKVQAGDWVALYGRLDWDGYMAIQSPDQYTYGRIRDAMVMEILSESTFRTSNGSVWQAGDAIFTVHGTSRERQIVAWNGLRREVWDNWLLPYFERVVSALARLIDRS